MFAIKIISFTFLILLVIVYLIMYSIHVSMVKGETITYGYATFEKFKKQFYKNKLLKDECYVSCYQNKTNNSIIHCDIIKFNGIGMILYPISFLKYKMFMHNLSKTKYIKVKW